MADRARSENVLCTFFFNFIGNCSLYEKTKKLAHQKRRAQETR